MSRPEPDPFAYHPPRSEMRRAQHEGIRAAISDCWDHLDELMPADAGVERALAHEKLREAMMWANAGAALSPDPDAEEG